MAEEREKKKMRGHLGRARFCLFCMLVSLYYLPGLFFISAKLSRGRDILPEASGWLFVEFVSWLFDFFVVIFFCFSGLFTFQSMLIAYAYFSCFLCCHLFFN